MNTVAIRLRRTSLDPASLVSKMLARLRERHGIIMAMHHLQSLPDYRLDDIGISRSTIPKLTGAEALPYLRTVSRRVAEQSGSDALNKAHFHTGK